MSYNMSLTSLYTAVITELCRTLFSAHQLTVDFNNSVQLASVFKPEFRPCSDVVTSDTLDKAYIHLLKYTLTRLPISSWQH